MKLKISLMFFSLVYFSLILSSQNDVRYLDPVFSEVMITADITYARNISYWVNANGELDTLDLSFDLYEPANDTLSARPTVVVVHGGYLLRSLVNGYPYGSSKDSSIVHLCTRLARHGFTAIALSYRTGWNPLAANYPDRRASFLQAFYRGVIDIRSSLRFLRKTIAEENNPYHVDGERIVLWGSGTGAYLVNGAAFLDQFSEISASPSFIDSESLTPYLDETVDSDPYGLIATNRNVVNHPTYSSDFAMAVSMDGAILDTNWIEGTAAAVSEPIIIGFHTVSHPFVDFAYPSLSFVWDVPADFPAFGTRLIVEMANNKGLNAVLNPLLTSPDALTSYSNGLQSTMNPALDPGQKPTTLSTDHFYPFITPDYLEELEPWQWWNFENLVEAVALFNQQYGTNIEPNQVHDNGSIVHPDMSAEKGQLYVDTLLQFFLPRACVSLDLTPCATIVEEELVQKRLAEVRIFPNPAQHEVIAQANLPIIGAKLFSSEGLLVKEIQPLFSNWIRIERSNLAAGIYFLHLRLENHTHSVQKVIWTP